MSEIKQFHTWGGDSSDRVVDLIDTSQNVPLPSSWALEPPDPYSEIEFGYYSHLSSAKNLPELEYKIKQSINDLGFQQFELKLQGGFIEGHVHIISQYSSLRV